MSSLVPLFVLLIWKVGAVVRECLESKSINSANALYK